MKTRPMRKRITNKAKKELQKITPTGRRRRQVSEILARNLPSTLVIDIGASYYPHERWSTFLESSNATWVLIDPNAESLGYVKTWKHKSNAISKVTGISAKSGPHVLYKTATVTGSSLLKPELSESMKTRLGKSGYDYFFPLSETVIQCSTIDDNLTKEQLLIPRIIKLDTQGTELNILKSIEKMLTDGLTVAVESESTLLAQPMYEDSGKFWQMQAFLESVGYETVYLKPIDSPQQGTMRGSRGFLNECDAAFAMRQDIAKQAPIETSYSLLAIYADYGMYREVLNHLRTDTRLQSGMKHSDLEKLIANCSKLISE